MIIVGKQRVVVSIYDGFGLDYLNQSPMPVFKHMMNSGFYKEVKSIFPTVTNTNNVSICCAALPKDHGITGNSWLDPITEECHYMEDADYILRPTMIQKAANKGVKCALLTSKVKTIGLLGKHAVIAVAAEAPPPAYVKKYGKPSDVYSCEINYWLWHVAIDIIKNRPDIGLLYVHTTDYPMHAWAPDEKESREHLSNLDSLLGEAHGAAPDVAFLITADHGMNYKTRCWDLVRACNAVGIKLKFALSPERDKYLKHHRTFGGAAWVWLNDPGDTLQAMTAIGELKGVEEVLTRQDAASRFGLMPERIGELVIVGDKDTVFGELDTPMELLGPTYRSHGSLHESDVPLLIFNSSGDVPSTGDKYIRNADLTRHLTGL